MDFILFFSSFFKDLLNLPNLTTYVHFHASPKHKILYLSDEKIKIKVHNFFVFWFIDLKLLFPCSVCLKM